MKRSSEDTRGSFKKMNSKTVEESIVTIDGGKFIDSGGGFLLDASDIGQEKKRINDIQSNFTDSVPCEKCKNDLFESYLLKNFEVPVCDDCRQSEEYTLMPKCDVMSEFLLNDGDLSRMEPPLKFINRPNPHNVNWGKMKLYLRCQVEKRAIEKWGSLEKLSEALFAKEEKRLKVQSKKYKKNIDALRKSMRSSCYQYGTGSTHKHEFAREVYNATEDNYSRKCETCGFVETFEKM